jgi:hypothetical protein
MKPGTLRLLFISGVLLAVCCSNPTDQSLRWQQKIEIPLSNQSFILGDQFKDLFTGIKDLENFEILGLGDSNALGVPDSNPHVLAFSKLTNDTFSFRQTHDTLEDKVFDDAIGVMTLSGLGTISERAALPVSGAIAADANFNVTDTIRFSTKVRSLIFSTQSPNLQLRVVDSANAQIDSLSITLLNVAPAPSASQTVSVSPSSPSATLSFAVGGCTVDSVLRVRIAGKVKAPATVNGAKGIMVSMTLDSLKATRVVVMDSLITIRKNYFNLYKITDSVDIDYVDILEGFFNYSCDNRSGLDLNVTGTHQHLWTSSICERKNVRSVDSLYKLASHSDTVNYYSGEITQGSRSIPAHQNLEFGRINISGNRLFPHWDSASSNSVTRVDYIVETPRPTGAWITLNAGDSLIFTIHPSAVNFRQFEGNLTENYVRTGEPQYVEFPWPWPKATKDSLRGKFNLSMVLSDTRINTHLPAAGLLDSLYAQFTIYDPAHPADSSDTMVVFTNVKDDTMYQRNLRVTKIVNYFPDSLAVLTRTTIPRGTHVYVVNDQILDPQSVGGMTVEGDVDYRLLAYLDWTVTDSALLDLGSGSFEMSQENMRLIRAMHNRQVTVNADVSNYTNVYLRLFAIVAPGAKKALIDSLTTGQISNFLAVPGRAEDSGYVNLFGAGGLFVPDRDSTKVNGITLNDRQLDLILQADSSAWRWLVRFYRNPRDSLMNTDSVKIRSWLHAEGTQYMDSVFDAFTFE